MHAFARVGCGLILALALLAGCRTAPPAVIVGPGAEAPWPEQRAGLEKLDRYSLVGRVAVAASGQGFSANLRYAQKPRAANLSLDGPLGIGGLRVDMQGEDIHIAAWPTVKEMLQVASRHYAFEGRCYVLAAGSLMRASALPPELEPSPGIVSRGDQFVLRGGSAIIAPNGSYVCEPVFEAPAVLIADLDLGATREEAMSLDVAGHYSRPDVFAFELTTSRRSSASES